MSSPVSRTDDFANVVIPFTGVLGGSTMGALSAAFAVPVDALIGGLGLAFGAVVAVVSVIAWVVRGTYEDSSE